MLIEILIILFTIIIFYEIFNDVFLNRSLMYENFDTTSNDKLSDQNNKDVEKLKKEFASQNQNLTNINTSLAKMNNTINILNQKIKAKSEDALQKYNEITEGADVDINDTENI
jgi:septal ring factor EnvC (AmiA/AmiB activator)